MDGPASFAEIINLWPSAADLARDLGLKEVTVRAWRHRGIPGVYWADLARLAAERGKNEITIERLAELGARESAA